MSLLHWSQNSPPFSLPCACSWPSKLASERCVHSLKLWTVRQPKTKKWDPQPFPSCLCVDQFITPKHQTRADSHHSGTGTTQCGCDFGSSTMLLAQLYTLQFQALWSSGFENYIKSVLWKETEGKKKFFRSTVTTKAWSWKLTCDLFFINDKKHQGVSLLE